MNVRFSILLVICVLAAFASASAQGRTTTSPTLIVNKPDTAARLIDQFPKLTSEDRSARFDNFFQELSRDPSATGYVFLFCGRQCRYDEIVAHMRGIEIKIALRKFDRSRLVVRDGGFREEFETELWLAPAGACPPTPESKVHIRNVVFTKPGKYPREAYECCDEDYSDVWKSIKP